MVQDADKSLSPTRLKKKQLSAEVIAATETWLDGKTPEFFFF